MEREIRRVRAGDKEIEYAPTQQTLEPTVIVMVAAAVVGLLFWALGSPDWSFVVGVLVGAANVHLVSKA